MTRSLRWLVVAWPWVMALLVCAPLLAPGFVLTYDMVWVPDLALRADTVGLGSALPRAVPSDALVAVLDEVVPGQVLQKLVLVGSLSLGGVGMARLWPEDAPVAALASASPYVWNPYVAERLVLGQWPLLVAYAALPWLIRSAWALRAGEPGAWPRLILAMAVTSLTPASGLMGVLAAMSCAVDPRAPGAARRAGAVLGAGVAANATWLVAGLVQLGATRTDPGAVALFDVQPEGLLGRIGSVLTLGGVWNTDVVPDSRTTAVGAVGALLVLGLVLTGLLVRRCRPPMPGLPAVAAVGVVVALSGWLVQDLVAWLSTAVPGGGLLRDGTRYLALLAPLEALLFGAGVAAACGWAARRAASWLVAFSAVAGVLLPLAVLPDLAWGAAGRLDPVQYPASWTRARAAVTASPVPGDVVVVPFAAYRAPGWNDGRPVLDPAGRFFDRTTLVNDELVVSGQVIAGEDPRARLVGDALDEGGGTAALAALGIGLVVDSAPGVRPPVEGDLIIGSPDIEVRLVDGRVRDHGPERWRAAAVAAGWALTLALVLGASWSHVRRSRRRDT